MQNKYFYSVDGAKFEPFYGEPDSIAGVWRREVYIGGRLRGRWTYNILEADL